MNLKNCAPADISLILEFRRFLRRSDLLRMGWSKDELLPTEGEKFWLKRRGEEDEKIRKKRIKEGLKILLKKREEAKSKE